MSSQMDQDVSPRADISDQDRHGEGLGKASCNVTLRAKLKTKQKNPCFLLHSYRSLLSFYLSSLFVCVSALSL